MNEIDRKYKQRLLCLKGESMQQNQFTLDEFRPLNLINHLLNEEQTRLVNFCYYVFQRHHIHVDSCKWKLIENNYVELVT